MNPHRAALLIATMTLSLATACDGSDSLICGGGTLLQDGVCLPDTQTFCSEGTRLEGDQCVPDQQVVCSEGTRPEDGVCVSDPQVVCSEGTRPEDGVCVSDPQVVCSEGTRPDGNLCVPDPQVVCSEGTTFIDGECVSDGDYVVRVGATMVSADGFTRVPVVVLGPVSGDIPATEEVFLSLSRAGAGELETQRLTPGLLGSSTTFLSCNSANDPTCIGPQRVRVSLFNDPDNVLAESPPFMLVEPTGVGSMASCDPFQNALHFDGSGFIFTGRQTVTEGAFSVSPGGPVGAVSLVSAFIDPSDSSQGSGWRAEFAAPDNAPLMEQVYPMAERYPFHPPGVAGLSIFGDGRGCNRLSGRFQIHRLVVEAGTVQAFEATFEQFCEQSAMDVLRGCIKFTR